MLGSAHYLGVASISVIDQKRERVPTS